MDQQHQKNTLTIGMTFMSLIFFIFGFVTTFNITLADKFKAVFNLSNFQALWVNFAFFLTYFVLSFGSGRIIKKIGYKQGVLLGLVLVGIGSFLFFPAAKAFSYGFFLIAIFVMASGVVFLQTAANPYVAALGNPQTASGRLNLTQALNSIATTIAPIIASVFVFSEVSKIMDASMTKEQLDRAVAVQAAGAVPLPFIIIGVLVLLIAVVIYFLRLPVISTEGVKSKSVWQYTHVKLGAFGIFCYVGAEVGCAAMIQQYLKHDLGFSPQDAAKSIAIYWGGAMIGRFFGSIMLSNITNSVKKYSYIAGVLIFALLVGWYLRNEFTGGLIFLGIAFLNYLAMLLGKGKANISLAVFGIIAAILVLGTMLLHGYHGTSLIWVACSIGFFNSIMFPNIFALSIHGLDKGEMSSASGMINTMIVGGALIPIFMGLIADHYSYSSAFILPFLCYCYIVYFALSGSKLN